MLRSVMPALLLTRDLFFSSRIAGTASALGLRVDVVPDAATACEKLRDGGYACLFVDLGDAAVDIGKLVAELSPDTRPAVVAFGAHVAHQRLEDAAAAGCDEVLTRGALSATLPALLQRYLSPR